MAVALAVVAHDPRDVLLDKLRALLRDVAAVFDGGIGVRASVDASNASLDVYRSFGAIVDQETLSSSPSSDGGRAWDLFIAVRGMSAATARLIVDACDEDTIGNAEACLPYENHTFARWGPHESR